MFTVSGLTSPVLYDFYRGSGAPIFRTFIPNSLKTSAPLYRIRSNYIKYKFVITRTTDCAGLEWVSDNVVQGSQEILINVDFTSETVSVRCGVELFEERTVNGETVTTDLIQSANTWLQNCMIARLIQNYSVVNKVMLGGIVFERFIGDSSPVSLDENFFEYQRENNIIRLQTPSDTLFVGNQPMKIYGSAALGSDLDISAGAVGSYDTFTTNTGIQQGVFKL